MRLLAILVLSSLPILGANAHPGEGDHPSNEVEILKPPTPNYPDLAAKVGLVGRCEVNFNLFDYGLTIDVQEVRCTAAVFCTESHLAIEGMKLNVKDVEGAPVPGARYKIIYPLEYMFEGVPDEIRTRLNNAPLRACTNDKTS